MIRMEAVTKKFAGSLAVDNLSLQVKKGEILGLVGPDGAGKSTTIRLMTGILKKFDGRIEVLGHCNIEKVKHQLGYVPQKFSLYRDLTVWENIELIGSLYGVAHAEILQQAKEILSFTGLWEFRQRRSDRLSGGMKQKLALATGLMHKPAIFFLDEPTTGVDPVARREFWQLLYQLNQAGMTIVVATPYMDEAELCHRVALFNEGRLICCETPAVLTAQYPHRILSLKTKEKHIESQLVDASILDIHSFGDRYHLVVTDIALATKQIEMILAKRQIEIIVLEEIKPSLEDVFVAIDSQGGETG